jgi:hypothetical protein
MLLVNSIGAFALVRFKGLDRDPHLLAQEAGNPAARGVFLPALCVFVRQPTAPSVLVWQREVGRGP